MLSTLVGQGQHADVNRSMYERLCISAHAHHIRLPEQDRYAPSHTECGHLEVERLTLSGLLHDVCNILRCAYFCMIMAAQNS